MRFTLSVSIGWTVAENWSVFPMCMSAWGMFRTIPVGE